MIMLIDGKKLAESILAENATKKKGELAIISIGNDPASEVYVRNKIRACTKCGITVHHVNFPASVDEEDVSYCINWCNTSKAISGVILQLPVPEKFNAQFLINQIDPKKDVDCLTDENRGLLYIGKPRFIPCTVKGVLKLIEHYGIKTHGRRVTILGRSELVGRPLAVILSGKDYNATVTLCNSFTGNIHGVCREADIIISAVGISKLITPNMVHTGTVIIDVGINKDEAGRICGDADFTRVAPYVSAITPVPGGVGPMTVAMLIDNIP